MAQREGETTSRKLLTGRRGNRFGRPTYSSPATRLDFDAALPLSRRQISPTDTGALWSPVPQWPTISRQVLLVACCRSAELSAFCLVALL